MTDLTQDDLTQESVEPKKGRYTTEFWLIIAVVVFAALFSFNVITPEYLTTMTERVAGATASVPALIDALKELGIAIGPLLASAGLAWAYLKRRTDLKKK